MQKILLSAISLIISVSLLVGAPVTEKKGDVNIKRMLKELKAEKDPFADPFAKSEAEILVEIEAKILEVDEGAFLDASKDLDGSPIVIPDSQASILLNALSREEATDSLSAPRITVKNGKKAETKVVQEFVLFPTIKPSTQATGEGDGRQVQEIGFELSVTPTVQKNNQTHLQLNLKVTQFEGFVESGGPSDPTGGIGFSKGLPPGILMPIFSKRKITTQVTLSDGETAIIDGLTRDEIKNVNEKNQVSTENNQTRSLLIFVSANIASAEGSPVRKNLNKKLEELKAEKNQLAEQLNKVNKRLAEIRAGIDQPTGESPKSSKVEIIGIGARLIDENGSCIIAELIPGGPAEKSQQLEPKDVILKVSKSDGTLADISDMRLYEIVELIKGPKNSKVKLLIQPFKNPSTPKEVSIKRKPFYIYYQTHENKVPEKADPVPTETPSGKKLIVHIVKRGDTVKSIAKKYGSKVKWILDANQLTDPQKIKVGEKIQVPQKSTFGYQLETSSDVTRDTDNSKQEYFRAKHGFGSGLIEMVDLSTHEGFDTVQTIDDVAKFAAKVPGAIGFTAHPDFQDDTRLASAVIWYTGLSSPQNSWLLYLFDETEAKKKPGGKPRAEALAAAEAKVQSKMTMAKELIEASGSRGVKLTGDPEDQQVLALAIMRLGGSFEHNGEFGTTDCGGCRILVPGGTPFLCVQKKKHWSCCGSTEKKSHCQFWPLVKAQEGSL